MTTARCSIDVRGLVQGVGFRPFVHGLAHRHALAGIVYNGPAGVHIEVEGRQNAIEGFVQELWRAPFPAAVEEVSCRSIVPRGASGFRIGESTEQGEADAAIPTDLATCDDCLRELFDPGDRRSGHPFISCTHCGPRATIVVGMPYDRARTTMSAFAMCPSCRAEYEAPEDRRFHAQPIACPECGPKLRLTNSQGRPLPGDPLAAFADAITAGRIGALKGIGGFHLVCDAENQDAVTELRRRKRRGEKPFALMAPDLEAASTFAILDDDAERALVSPARPIVLAPRRLGALIADAVAPGVGSVGVMLPYAPVHHLLFARIGRRALVFTSGNLSDEPIAHTDAEAYERLGDVADSFLTHDRPIHVRADDSVVQSTPGGVAVLRRARGYAPQPVPLAFDVGSTLALGGHSKAVFALGLGRRAVLGAHFGDLDGLAAYRAYTDGVEYLERVHAVRAVRLVHDLHPDYASTRYARERFERGECGELVAVQHHHAHLASCMAENRLEGTVIGVCFDGAGLGLDGTLWGGEFLVGGYAGAARAAHFSPVPLPGGDRAAREPFRTAAACLWQLGLSLAPLERRVAGPTLHALARVVDSGSCPRTSSVGRLFDAVASLAGVLDVASYEGQAALLLQTLAAGMSHAGSYPVALRDGAPFVVDTAPLVEAVAADVSAGVDASTIARRFHAALVDASVDACSRIRDRTGVDRVALSGGVFANTILAAELPARLAEAGFHVFTHRVVPPNDGGLCLGQLAVAAHGGGVPSERAREAS
ncbi:MAG TPA: carbamoyltransferase HypF [Polyangiaceae bacterium]|nr:carbamoyltransferase HypF [Polyangiaceae bacterium]